MAFREELEVTGTRLFKGRSYFPLIVLVFLLYTLRDPSTSFAGVRSGPLWSLFCLAVGLAGLAIRCVSVGYAGHGTSGRQTRTLDTASLNSTGFYSVVRHPLYLGNYLMWLGPALFARSWSTAVIVTLVFWLYYERIIYAEEALLRRRFGKVFEEWAAKTPAFIPRWRQWQRPHHAYSLQRVVLAESTGLLGLVSVFCLMDVVARYFGTGQVGLNSLWLGILIPTLLIALYARVHKMIRRRARRSAERPGAAAASHERPV